MANPLYQALGGQQPNMMAEFQKFMQQMQGVNPYEEINKLLRSGRITQSQLNAAQQQAQQFMGMIGKR